MRLILLMILVSLFPILIFADPIPPDYGGAYLVNNSQKNMTIYFEFCNGTTHSCWFSDSIFLPKAPNPNHQRLLYLKTVEKLIIKYAIVDVNKPTIYPKNTCETPASSDSAPYHGTLTFDAANIVPPFVRCQFSPAPPN